ncbi:MAG: hypothetical protein GX638_10065 [Crenarchaeota archaeon]|nr:hypothetical protein [Thermoproteota archaeon]
MTSTDKSDKDAGKDQISKLPCGCIYQDKGWILMRIFECEYHKRKRNRKRPYRPKAECVRP